jgi:hypothetical protein
MISFINVDIRFIEQRGLLGIVGLDAFDCTSASTENIEVKGLCHLAVSSG